MTNAVGRRAGDWLRRAPLAVPVVVVLVAGWIHRWITDDGYIYLRIVSQVVDGNGPVFNAGERVEAFTSPSWVAVLSVLDVLLPIRLEWIAVLLGFAATIFGVVAAMAGARRLAGAAAGRTVVPAGALVAVAPFGTWIWITSGMETSLTWAWLGSCLYVLARWASGDGRISRPEGVLLGLGWLVRPELVLFSTLFLAVVLAAEWTATTWRSRLATVGTFVAIPVAYQVFRMGYFGLLVANTAVAKEGTSVLWERGMRYLRDFADPYWLWVPVLAVVAGGYVPLARGANRRQRLVIGAFLGGTVVTTLYVVSVGGDYMHGRFFMPMLFALCAPVAAVTLERRFAGLAVIGPWAILAVVVMRPPALEGGFLSGFTFVPWNFGEITVEQQQWGDDSRRMRFFTEEALYVETRPFGFRFDPATFEPADGVPLPAVLSTGIGIVGYALGPDYYIVDPLGLAHPIGSHYEASPNQAGAAGHDKPAPIPWLVAQLAAPGEDGVEAPAFGVAQSQLIEPTEGAALRAQVQAARRTLRCEPLRRLHDAANGDFGPRRFLRNLVQAPANTFVRIPPDPEEAEAELC